MSAKTLALLEQGVRADLEGGRLRVERAGETVAFARLEELGEVLAFGDVQITPRALLACLRVGVDVQFLTETGFWRGRLVGKPGRQVELRLAQYEQLSSSRGALELARAIVAGKLSNQRQLLLGVQRERQPKSEAIAEAIADLRVRATAVASAPSLEVLRGVEGLAAASYFDGLAAAISNPAFSMRGRSRRPPRDAPNAVLSFGYTLLAGLVESAVLRAGLDPYLGALHAPGRGHPSLALDLMEEWRPVVVDSLMLALFNHRQLASEDFQAPPADETELDDGEPAETTPSEPHAGVWLGDTGRRIFFRAWGRKLRVSHWYSPQSRSLELEEILRQQVFQLCRVLSGEEPTYKPFQPR